MSFMDKARQAAEQARQAASQAIGQVASEESQSDMRTQLRQAAGQARRGVVTLVERIDPATLADIIIKATAIQERTNTALRDKHSAYRIGELTITATIPPQLGFAITRVGDEEPGALRAEDSRSLVDSIETADAAVVSLDGAVMPAAEAEQAAGDTPEENTLG